MTIATFEHMADSVRWQTRRARLVGTTWWVITYVSNFIRSIK